MFYNARWYDPSLGRFAQADTIVPTQTQGVQAWDRYAYVNNNPVKYVDPSGHGVCNERDENGECMSEQEEIMNAILEQNNRLAKRVKNGKLNDLEAFAKLVEYAASLTPGCMKCLIKNIGSIITGYSKGNYAKSELTGADRDSYYFEAEKFGQSGYDPIFQDPPRAVAAGGGNQAFHFWFYVQVAFESGQGVANAGVLAHETVLGNPAGMSNQDLYLGYEGAKLGAQMAAGTISTSDIGDYILQTLSPGSPTAQYYQVLNNQPSPVLWP